jgi:S-adenosylmethionine decarboxylase
MKIKTKGFYNPCNSKKIQCAGIHLILEFWGAENLDSIKIVKQALIKGVEACGATLLKLELHKFSPQGISGVAVIAESHISIHTWPEHQYAAIDVFMCGEKDPYQVIGVFKKAFEPKHLEIVELKRGVRL